MKKSFLSALACLAVVAAIGVIFSLAPTDVAAAQIPLAASLQQLPFGGLELAGLIGMTTLASDLPRDFELGDFDDVPAVASDIIYDGSAVGDNASGYGRPLVAGDKFRGFCVKRCDNLGGAAGDLNINVRVRGKVELTVSGVAITDVGKAVYASDDNAFTLTETSNSYIGVITRYVSATRVVVAFDATRGGLAGQQLAALALASTDGANTAWTWSGTLTNTPGATSVADGLNAVISRLNRLEKMLVD